MKVLVLRFSSIGDMVLTSPVVRCLKQQLPNAVIHYATKEQYAFLVHPNPYISKVHLLNNNLSKLIQELKKESFDVVVDLHNNQRTALIKLQLKAKSYSYYKTNIEKWLMVHLKVDKLPRKSIVDRYMDTCAALGIQNDQRGMDYFIPPSYVVDIQKQFPSVGTDYIAYAIGGQHSTKIMPKERIVELCRQITQPIILLGGPDDAEAGQYIAAHTTNAISACGELHMHQSASVANQAQWVISHDTGMMHISAALGKRVISLWGNTIPEMGMFPYQPQHQERNHIVEVKGLSCRPCSKIGYSQCPKGHFKCMNDISLSEILHILTETSV